MFAISSVVILSLLSYVKNVWRCSIKKKRGESELPFLTAVLLGRVISLAFSPFIHLSSRPVLRFNKHLSFLTADGLKPVARARDRPLKTESRCQTRKLPSPFTHPQTAHRVHPKTSNSSAILPTHPPTGNLHTAKKNSHTI